MHSGYSENTSVLVKHDIFLSVGFSEYNRAFLLPTHMVLIVARQVSAAEETTGGKTAVSTLNKVIFTFTFYSFSRRFYPK